MTFNSILTKVLAGTVFAGGITVAGINYKGTEDVNNIKGMAEDMRNNFVQAVSDKDYIKGKFQDLKTMYKDATTEANNTIGSLKTDKADLVYSVNELTTQLEEAQAEIARLQEAGASDEEKTEAQAELQNVIGELEEQLDRANIEIAGLEAEVSRLKAETEYTSEDKTQYDVEPIEIEDNWESAPVTNPEEGLENFYTDLVDQDAIEQNGEGVKAMNKAVPQIEAELNNFESYVDIIGVQVVDGQLAYVITQDTNAEVLKDKGANSDAVMSLAMELGYDKLDFVMPTEGRYFLAFSIGGDGYIIR
jgi:DNA repair exonuclease SbcCD ATPase subunit